MRMNLISHCMTVVSMLVIVTACSSAVALAQSSQPSAVAAGVAAVIDSVPILDADLDVRWQTQDPSAFERVRRDTYEGRRHALDALLAERLLAAEAGRLGLQVAELVDREVTRRVRPVTELEVSAFLAVNPVPGGAPTAVVTSLVASLLGQRARVTARDEYLAALRRAPSAQVRILLEPPRVSLRPAVHSPTRGSASAPVEVVIFSDFECPFCRRAETAFTSLFTRFADDVRFVWRHYPLSSHPRARPAAEAAQCAHDQGAFWAYHDALFTDAAQLDVEGFTASAVRLGLDADEFSRCLRSGRHSTEVGLDSDAGARAGVTGTPTVFVNGIAIVGAQAYEVYERVIVDELARGVINHPDTSPSSERVNQR
jgi:protein-disulfide isomerase